jgi:hypothetical protein
VSIGSADVANFGSRSISISKCIHLYKTVLRYRIRGRNFTSSSGFPKSYISESSDVINDIFRKADNSTIIDAESSIFRCFRGSNERSREEMFIPLEISHNFFMIFVENTREETDRQGAESVEALTAWGITRAHSDIIALLQEYVISMEEVSPVQPAFPVALAVPTVAMDDALGFDCRVNVKALLIDEFSFLNQLDIPQFFDSSTASAIAFRAISTLDERNASDIF